jgi:two-component system sensor histidine kinase PilS (NtrC family)
VLGKDLAVIEPDLLPFFEKIDSKRILDESDDQKNSGIETELTATGTEWHRSVFLSAKLSRGSARLQQTVEVGNGKSKRLLRGDVAEVEMGEQTGEIWGRIEGLGRVLLFQDVTKLVHLEEKLKQNEKLAAVGQLAAGIAHEIRNPLASMSGSVQMLQENSGGNLLSPEDQKLMNIIRKEIERLNGLVNEFLSFVKPDQFEIQTVDLESLLADIAIQVSNRKNEFPEVRIFSQLKSGIKAQGNSEKLAQVAWNLITNALQAMRGPGKVSIGCDEVSSHWVCFWIEDEGEGMTENTLQHIYEQFFTTKPKGTGLGLETVYKIVEAHQGEIRVQSKKGEGTRFEIHLPKA